MTDFQSDTLKLAAIKLKDKPETLSGLIKEQLAIANHTFGGILNADLLSALLSIAYDLEKEEYAPEIIANFNDKLWKCIHDEPHVGYQYSLILPEIFESYNLARTVTLSTFVHYFKYINMDTLIKEWHEESIENLVARNMIEKPKGKYFSLDHSDLSYGFIRYINDDCRDYFFENANAESASIYAIELCRNIFVKKGCFGSTNLLKSILIKRPDIIKPVNDAVNKFISQSECRYENYDFFDNDFSTCAISYIRTQTQTLRHAIKAVRVARGSEDDLIEFLNKTRGNATPLLDFICAILRISPFDLLDNKKISNRAKSLCIKALSS